MRNLIEKLTFQYHSLDDASQVIVDIVVLVGISLFLSLLFVLIINLIATL